VTGFPDEPGTHLTVVSGGATLALRVRVPSWVAGTARVLLNGEPAGRPAAPGSWLVLERRWRRGDTVDVSLPMRLALSPAPDSPRVQAVTYGPVVLSGGYGGREITAMPRLSTGSVTLASAQPLAFQAVAGGQPVMLVPVARMHHQYYNVYWLT
jgi:hypothetical protein